MNKDTKELTVAEHIIDGLNWIIANQSYVSQMHVKIWLKSVTNLNVLKFNIEIYKHHTIV